MASPSSIRTELDEQRCLIEQQQIEIRRLLHHLEVQTRVTAHLQTEINDLKASVQRGARRPLREIHHSGNGHGEERHLSNETMSRRDQQT